MSNKATRPRTNQGLRVAVVAMEGISPLHLAVPCAVLGDDELVKAGYQVLVCAPESELGTTAGFSISVSHGLEVLRKADMVIVPSWPDPNRPAPDMLLAALRKASQRGAVMVGLCLGAFVLAQAGLLDDRRVATHWAYATQLAEQFPAVMVDPGVLYVDEGAVITSAGTAAGIDCCLHIIRRHSGADLANRIARRLVVSPHRLGGQAQFIEHAVPEAAADLRMSALLDWMRANLDEPHSLDALAQRMHMTRRTFTRHFRHVTGVSVTQWLIAQRVALAQQWLERGAVDMERLAQEVGFGSALSLRSHFRKLVGMSPSAWRASFAGV